MWQWWIKNRILLLGLTLVLAALLVYSLGLKTGAETGWVERLALSLGRPLLGASSSVRYGTAGIWGAIVPGGSLDLDAENRRLRAELASREELLRENERLRRLLGFVEETPAETLAARVIAEDAIQLVSHHRDRSGLGGWRD